MRRRRVTVNPCSCGRPIREARMGPPLSHAKADWALDPGPCFVWEGNLTPVVLTLWEVCGRRRARSRGQGRLDLNCWATLSLSDEASALSAFPPPARLWVWIYLEAGYFLLRAQSECRPSPAPAPVIVCEGGRANRHLSATTLAWVVNGSPGRRRAVEELATGAGEPGGI